MIIILCCLCSSIIGGIAWYRRDFKKEGDPCEGSDTFAKYVIDSEGNCVMDRCVYGYEKENGVCVIKKVEDEPVVEPPNTVPEITFPSVDPEEAQSGPAVGIVRPEIVRPEIVRPEIVRPDIVRPEIVRPDIQFAIPD